MSFLATALLSLVEGITEFLPVSSTGHLILTSSLLGLPQTEAQKSFEIAIQMGAILAVIVLYGKTLLRDQKTILLVGIAFIPTAIIGLAVHGFAKRVLLGNVPVVLWSLFLGGIVLMVFENMIPKNKKSMEIKDMSYAQAAIVGVCQSLAIIPGVSRSAATIVGGEFLGLRRAAIVEFSFLLAIPTMAAATGLDLVKSASLFTLSDVQSIATGFILSFVVALVAVRWFIEYVKNHSFAAFGVYRILLACIFWIWIIRNP